MYTFHYDSETDLFSIEVRDGTTAMPYEVARALSIMAGGMFRGPNTRLLTVSEVQALKTLPPGWERTLDGVDNNNGVSEVSVRRISDGLLAKVPVSPDGTQYGPATRKILAAIDALPTAEVPEA